MNKVKRLVMAAIISCCVAVPVSAYAVETNNNEQDINNINSETNVILNEQIINENTFSKENNSDDLKAKGWHTIDNNKYYYTSDNEPAKDWVEIDDKWYCFDENGKLLTGFITKGNNTYYSDADGVRQTGWITSNNSKYYFLDNGVMAKGLTKIEDNTYLFSNDGIMLTGWKYLSNNKWYLFNNEGFMQKGWFYDNNYLYYLNEDGTMSSGWKTIDGKDYYFNSSGAMRCGWTGIGKDIYYFDNKGVKASDVTVNGYTLDKDGKLILPSGMTEPNIDKLFTEKNININTDECEYKSTNKGIAESTFKGIDISNHNGYVDFNAIKNAGVKVVYMKASESNYYIDQYAAGNAESAKNAGLKVGYYHYLTGTSSPEEQARLFYNCIKDKPNDLKPCVDVEVSPSTAADYTVRFINEFKKYSNMDVCIYTYTNFINNLDSRLAGYSLWEANYNNSPFNIPANSIWTSKAGHQYTDKGTISGVGGNLDFDMFNHDILL
ncbi:GH25 family lysozyme [uncultured Clostridium sp.]|uniref:GH25 family lysozyme n=1 Tax=uncultured Clostridium sp. TaxID=59620 RepID=UPI0025CE86B1|nr:GH25 family lysozyme [uncultured Clostridium sp.]